MKESNPDRVCVKVFAKISAAISHEIKNTLSIINENAGLLDDYAQMAEQGGDFPLDRVQSITVSIAKQVDRSNIIMKNLNRYAHSGDTSPSQTNLRELLSLMVTLASRQAAMKEVDVKVDCAPDLAIQTHLIALESLIYLTLLTLYNSCEAGCTITVQAKEEKPKTTLCFTVADQNDLKIDMFPDADQQLLANQLSSNCHHKANQLTITLPTTID